MKRTILGLDLGTNSIGWDFINLDDQNQKAEGGITAAGVRIFQETTDSKSKEPKNQSRREKRGMRRTIARRTRRHRHLQNILRQAGILPDDDRKVEEIMTIGELACNPYLFRKKGLDERLELREFGRVLCHLNQRRGFQSNRKAGSKSSEDSEYKKMMAELEQAIKSKGYRTIGEHTDEPAVRFTRIDRNVEDFFQKSAKFLGASLTLLLKRCPDLREVGDVKQ